MGNGLCDRESLFLPDSLWIEIFANLNRTDLISCSIVCQQWSRVAKDQALWKKLFILDFKLDSRTTMASSCRTFSWYDEYRRVIDESPVVLAQALTDHTDEVLHVAFAHNGSMFSTCSKDCTFKIWDSSHPCRLIHQQDLGRKFLWKYTQFSQFNVDDRLLLVSGVHFGEHTTTGEIAVFEITHDNLLFRCRIINKPYDIFGCWFSPSLLLSGEIHLFTDHMTSFTDIWLCRASQELHSVRKSVMAKLFKFYNPNSSSVRMLLTSNYVSDWVKEAVAVMDKLQISQENGEMFDKDGELKRFRAAMKRVSSDEDMDDDYVVERKDSNASSTSCVSKSSSSCSSKSGAVGGDRLVIFSTGTETYTPHVIGFKLVKQDEVEKILREETMSPSRLKQVKAQMLKMRDDALRKLNPAADVNAHPPGQQQNFDNDAFLRANFDLPDHLIDMRGHIVGAVLSDDERYLFVNVRPWPDDAIISDPLEPPPIAQQIEVRVIDLEKLLLLPKIYRGHRGFTPNDDCFFIFLNACETYVASGSEDKFAYVWDRHYNFQLAHLPHDAVVNSVAFNPKSAEMLVSVSDDHTIKIWRSKNVKRSLDIKIDQ